MKTNIKDVNIIASTHITNTAGIGITEINENDCTIKAGIITSDSDYTDIRQYKLYFTSKGAYFKIRNNRHYLQEFIRH